MPRMLLHCHSFHSIIYVFWSLSQFNGVCHHTGISYGLAASLASTGAALASRCHPEVNLLVNQRAHWTQLQKDNYLKVCTFIYLVAAFVRKGWRQRELSVNQEDNLSRG